MYLWQLWRYPSHPPSVAPICHTTCLHPSSVWMQISYQRTLQAWCHISLLSMRNHKLHPTWNISSTAMWCCITGIWCLIFWDNVVVLSSRVKSSKKTHKHKTTTPSQHTRNQKPSVTMSYPTRGDTSSTPLQKPKNLYPNFHICRIKKNKS